nr:hypothetical protein [Gemmatales bacterium]
MHCLRFFTCYLSLLCISSSSAHEPVKKTLKDRTLVAWGRLAHLNQRGGSLLTIENEDGTFEGIVLGERSPRRWMPGSEFFKRTPAQQDWPEETAGPAEVIQLALVTEGNQQRLYRNGELLTQQVIRTPVHFDENSLVVIGLRHLDAGDQACLEGSVLDARIYDRALTREVLQSLRPGKSSSITPFAWWNFTTSDNSKAEDIQKRIQPGQLQGKATLSQGELRLPGGISYFRAGTIVTRSRDTELWPRWHISVLPEEGVALPYDANGCIYWKGKYHLMYIYQDPVRPHGGHCWGHLSSTDLVNWTYHPPALLSELSGTDVGIFSGNAFLGKEGKPMLCWFGIEGGVCVATAEDDELIRWKKHPNNPIIPIPRKGDVHFGKYTVWDPYLWYEGGQYWCLLGGNTLPNKKDTLFLCTSSDLVNWKHRHAFFEHADLNWTVEGEDCSCPDFFRLGNKHALLCISHKVGARLYLGEFDQKREKFVPEQHIRMNWPGGTFFAPESLLDNQGRRIIWAWVTDPRHRRTQRATGSGVQSMPRILGLSPAGRFTIEPAPELQNLREKPVSLSARKFGAAVELPELRGFSKEIDLEIDTKDALEVGVKV